MAGEDMEPERIPTKFFVVQVPRNKNIDVLELIRVRKNLMNLPIYSAVILEEHPDLIFVEADNFLAVAQAVAYFRYARAIEEPLSPVEVERLLRGLKEVISRERAIEEEKVVEFQVGQIVKIVRGPFKDRKARIVSVSKNKLFVDLMSGATLLIEISPEDVELVNE